MHSFAGFAGYCGCSNVFNGHRSCKKEPEQLLTVHWHINRIVSLSLSCVKCWYDIYVICYGWILNIALGLDWWEISRFCNFVLHLLARCCFSSSKAESDRSNIGLNVKFTEKMNSREWYDIAIYLNWKLISARVVYLDVRS